MATKQVQINKAEITRLIEVEGWCRYVNQNSRYDPEKKNSIQDLYGLTRPQTQQLFKMEGFSQIKYRTPQEEVEFVITDTTDSTNDESDTLTIVVDEETSTPNFEASHEEVNTTFI